ncbi:MAG: 4'-phosphopantetheinyl transferase superfamily protein [Oscillospiraceae bacterium]|nr:4'-phosphopantetheinyl transferase superfamily protein [Oscillospiraceae bacterium]
MIDVFYLFVDNQKSFEPYRKYMKYISVERQKRIERFYFDKDKITSLFSELLARKVISEKTGLKYDDIVFLLTEKGKPYILQADSYHFSVSHSGRCIVFADNTSPIGVDTEFIKDAKMNIAKNYFSADEYEYIKQSGEPDRTFFEIWTKKEAYVKMTGEGISVGFDTFSTFDEKKKKDFYTWGEKGYMFSVCTENLLKESIKIKELSEKNILQSFFF